MTLIAESGGDSYLGQRHRRPRQLSRHPLGAQISHVVPEGGSEMRAELASEVCRADPDGRRDLRQAEAIPESRMEELLREQKPVRDAGVKPPHTVATNGCRQHGLHEAIHHERRQVIRRVDLVRDAVGIGGDAGVTEVPHRIEERTEGVECGRLRLHHEDTSPLSSNVVGVSLT
jgi:hypothetical protein